MNDIEKLKQFQFFVKMYFFILFFLLVNLLLLSILLFYLNYLGLIVLYFYLFWLFLLGIGGLLQSFIDDYKWSLFHLECKKNKRCASIDNFIIWKKANGLN